MIVAVGVLNLKETNSISTLRTAEHFGVRRVFLIGDALKHVEKQCVSCHRHMLIKRFNTEENFITYIRQQGYKLILIEETENSNNIVNYEFPNKCVIMSGREETGFSEYLLKEAEGIVHIPCVGFVKCMNTSAAFAIAMYKFFEQKVLK